MDMALSLAKTSRYTGVVNIGAHMHQDVTGPRLIGPSLSLELPIFDQRQALIVRLEAQRRQAQRRLDALGLDVRSQVRLAKAQLELSRHAAEQYICSPAAAPPQRARAVAAPIQRDADWPV